MIYKFLPLCYNKNTNKHKNADVCTDYKHCQEYKSKEELLNKIPTMIKELKIFPCLCGSALLDEGVEDFIRWFHNLSFTNYEESEDSFKGRVCISCGKLFQRTTLREYCSRCFQG